MIGSPAGMKTLVVTKSSKGKIEVLDLATAFERELLVSPGLRVGNPYLRELNNAAPNLALNVKNATSSSRELWLWAGVGLVLQIAAMVIPGMATYFWKWEKANVPIARYGYPCFLVGTLLVIAGVVACGHCH